MKRRWNRLLMAALIGLFFGGGQSAAATQTLYLIQDSGWMEPFYSDRTVPFRPLLKAFIAASHEEGDVVVASFNQDGQLPGKHSPREVYRGLYSESQIDAVINALTPPVRPDGHMTDADFNGALQNAVNVLMGGRSGIIWMITNNKNSPNNSQEVNANTRAFAGNLRTSAALPYIVAYPIRMRAVGNFGTHENGLIIYGIAYGAEAEAALRAVVQSERLRTLFKGPAAELKSQQDAPLFFLPLRSLTQHIDVTRDGRNGLRVDGVEESGGRIVITGKLRSEYFPLMIEQADTSVRWIRLDNADGLDGLPASIEPGTIRNLAPQDTTPNVTLTITVPEIKRPPGLDGLLKSEQYVRGVLELDLSNLSLGMQDSFRDKLSTIAALDQLPDVFFDYRRVKTAKTTIPIIMRIHYSPWPLILAVALGLLLLIALIIGALASTRDREYTVRVGDKQQRLRLRAFETKIFKLPDGGELSITGMPFGPGRIRKTEALKPAEPTSQRTVRAPRPKQDVHPH